jgi:hypothetical protein
MLPAFPAPDLNPEQGKQGASYLGMKYTELIHFGTLV